MWSHCSPGNSLPSDGEGCSLSLFLSRSLRQLCRVLPFTNIARPTNDKHTQSNNDNVDHSLLTSLPVSVTEKLSPCLGRSGTGGGVTPTANQSLELGR